ncbi:CoA-transferase family III domain-containing protein [Xylogone sp. PMI_703]|nr:CoA-transferase family III domain-containing protein [Xylogone sp. PMI_703]
MASHKAGSPEDPVVTSSGSTYTLQAEAKRIFDRLVNDPKLDLPEESSKLAYTVQFDGDETQPFYPVPYKCAEAQAAVLGYVGLLASTISKIRYGEEEEVKIDVAQAMLNGLGALFIRSDGEWLSGNKKMIAGVQRWDHGRTRELYRQLGTNIYKTKDGRWYSLHGNMDPTPLLTMLGLPQHDDQQRSWGDILKLYMDTVATLDSKTLDNWSNNVYRVPGTICYEVDEFMATEHGQAIKDEPLYNLIKQPYAKQPPVDWERPDNEQEHRPLSGIKVLELARAIAAPTIGRVLAALGATVIRVSSKVNTELPITLVDGCIGKISVDINLKTFEGRKKLMELIMDADVFIDGYRPAVLEHLGFGRDAVLGLVSDRNKGIIYCQENCYGWKGPWATRPGWAQIADTVTGIGLGVGRFNGFEEAHIFPGPNSDYLTGHAGAASVLHALILRHKNGGSYNTQCALTISNLHMLSYGTYTADQIAALKKRNPELVGHMRHYDEIVSHGKNRHCVRGFIADRGFEKAIKKEYYEEIDGNPWGWGPLNVCNLAVRFSKTKTNFPIGACPPGYHLPQWTVERNTDFEPLPPYVEA